MPAFTCGGLNNCVLACKCMHACIVFLAAAVAAFTCGGAQSRHGSLQVHACAALKVKKESWQPSTAPYVHGACLPACLQLIGIFSGGALVIAKAGTAAVTNPSYMAGLIRHHSVSWVLTVPSLSLLYFDALAAEPCPRLRTLVSAGTPAAGLVQ